MLLMIQTFMPGENGACERDFFPCYSGPDGAVQCIRSYLVCDGSHDCKSGADEDAAICEGEFIWLLGNWRLDNSCHSVIIEPTSLQSELIITWLSNLSYRNAIHHTSADETDRACHI